MRRAPFLIFVALLFVPRATWSQGNPLGPEFRVNTNTTGSQGGSGGYDCPCENGSSVTADAAGNFVVVWHSEAQDGSATGVFGQRYAPDGAPLGLEFRVNTYTTDIQGYPSVAADSAGNFVVAWHGFGQDGSGSGIFGQRYANSGIPLGPEFRVNGYTTGFQRFPSVAADAAGRFVVVWMGGANYEIFGQRYDSFGAPLGSEFQVSSYPPSGPRYPSVAADPGGNFIVVWDAFNHDGSGLGIFGQRYSTSGAPLGGEFRVNTYTTGNQLYPSVAADSLGDFVVAWSSATQNGLDAEVFAQRYASSGSPLGSEFRVNAYTTGWQWRPEVAADSSGNFVIVWSGDDGNSGGVLGQRYASSGTPLGPEFRINTYTPNYQTNVTVAADDGPLGNFVAVWQSHGQDGSNWGVFGQRYGRIVPVELIEFTVE